MTKQREDHALPRTVGSIFRTAREVQRLSQEQVAALTADRPGGISRTMISAIERGRSLPGLEALVSLSRVLNIDPQEVLERVDLSMTVPADVTGRSLEELGRLALDYFWQGEYRKALAVWDAGLERIALEPGGHESRLREMHARFEINRAVALRRCRALRAAQSAAQRAVELTREFPRLRSEAYVVLASVLSQEGLHTLARDASARAISLADDAGPKQQALAANQQGNVLHRAGEFEEARRAFLRARDLAVRAGDEHHRIKSEGNIGMCLMALGRLKQARAKFAKAVELARRARDRAAEALWLLELGRIAFDEFRTDDAERFAREALRIAKPGRQWLTVFQSEWLLHQIVRRRDPGAPDRHRLAYLRKLWSRLKDHRGLGPIREFEETVIRPARGGEDTSP